MSFRFPLDMVLRLRQIKEDEEERSLSQILFQIAEARNTLLDLHRQVEALLRRRELDIQQPLTAANLHISYGQMRALENMEKDLRDQLGKLEALRIQQMKVYEAARRDRELLSGMRKKQHEQYRYEQARREQNTMDDNFGSRRNRH